MDYYLTDTIIIRDDIMYHGKNKITTKNWHILLSEYGWEKINVPWIKQLNKLKTINSSKSRNSCYGVYDCEQDGNCFFQCIANALNERDRYIGEEYDQRDIRNMIAESITEDNFKTLMTYYRIMKDADDFDEEWDPYQVDTIDDFKQKITQSGHCYWGDYLLLNLITRQLELNIMILNSNDDDKDYRVYNTLIEYNPQYNSIFLLYEDNCHFKLVGYFDNQLISYFTDKTIPDELSKLFNLKKSII